MDDSKSMADSGCGGFALEALTLMCRAMARLEVGELGVVRFGGPAGVVPLQVCMVWAFSCCDNTGDIVDTSRQLILCLPGRAPISFFACLAWC